MSKKERGEDQREIKKRRELQSADYVRERRKGEEYMRK